MRSSAFLHAGRSGAGLVAALGAALALELLGSACAHGPYLARTPAPAPPTVEYRVKRGDTLPRIAAWHGVDVEQVRRLNLVADALVPGRVLRIPRRPLATYTLRPGDTLARVGQRYGVGVDALVRLNDVADVRRVPAGQVIRIPATATRGRATLARQRPASAPRPVAVRSPPPVAAGPPATPAPTSPTLRPESVGAEIDRTLAQASDSFEAADFEGALAAAQAAQDRLPAEPQAPEDRHRLARAHLIAGMSNVALGRDEEARRSFRAAVALDEAIAPDPARTSPKILTVFNEAQPR